MFTNRTILFSTAVALVGFVALLNAKERPAREAPPAFLPVAQEHSAKIIVDPPLAEGLARGVAIVQFRTENARILPVFGATAVNVSPRIGHLHVTVDDAPWHWAHTSNDPVIVSPLTPGPHKILIELADANHKVLATETVKFEVPGVKK
jgi:hypothetical protein